MSVESAIEVLEQQVTGSAPAPEAQPESAPGDPDAWYDGLPEEARPLADAYAAAQVARLKTALDDERKQRKAFEKQVKDLSAKVGGDDEIKGELDGLRAQLTESNLKAAFYESASEQSDLPAKRHAAAFKIARVDGLINEDGEVDWSALRQQHDYLFSATQEPKRAPGSAGSGISSKPAPAKDMNRLIRGG